MKQLVRQMEQGGGVITEGKLLTYSVLFGQRALDGSTVHGTIQQGRAWFATATRIYMKQWGKAMITYRLAEELK